MSWNAAAEKIFGYSEREMIGQSIACLFPEDRADEEERLIGQVRAGGEIDHFETQRRRKDGELIDVSVTLTALRDVEGEIIAVSKIARDITSQKRLKNQVEVTQLSADLQQVLEDLPFMVALWDGDQRNRFSNVPYAASLGHTPESLRGLHASEALEPSLYKHAQSCIESAIAGESLSFEKRAVLDDGSVRHDLVNYIPSRVLGPKNGYFEVLRDITRLVNAEQAAAAAGERFRQLYEATPALIHSSSPSGLFLAVSDYWLKKFGYERDEVLGRNVADFLTPQSRIDRQTARASMAETNHCEDIALQVICKSGQPKDVLMSAIYVRDDEGRVVRALTVLQDVTEHLVAEQALAKSQWLLTRTAELSAVGGWEFDIALRRLTWSAETCRIHGVPLDYQPSRARAAEFYPPEARARINNAIAHSLATGAAWDLELPLIRADGKQIWVRNVGTVEFEDGQPVRWVAALQDITERWQLQTRLVDQESLLRHVMNVCPQGIFMLDSAGRCIFVNEAWQAITGVSQEQAIATDIRQFIHHDDMAKVITKRQLVLDEGGVQASEHRMVRPDGSCIWVSARLAPLRGEAPHEGFVGTVENVTERYQHAAALAAKSAELARSNEDLERLAYVTSHDLQEPLRMVNSYGQLLLSRYGAELSQPAQEFLHFMVDGGQRAHALIRDLLSIARIGSRMNRNKPLALETVLADALHALRLRVDETGATITHDPLPVVMADAVQMGQLFGNLLGNALKFHGKEAPVIHIGVEAQGEQWRISVRDDGIGIEPKFFDRIFVMFQRLHLRSEHEGTGIGLAICKKVVEQHGGTISVVSQPGQGTTFYFTLPNLDGPTLAAAKEAMAV